MHPFLRYAARTLLSCMLVTAALVLQAKAAPLFGTKSVGPTGDYASLTAAIADVNAVGNGLGGALVLELQATYLSTVETFPLTIPALNGASAVNTLSIRPQAGATNLKITGLEFAAAVELNGAQFVTLDGRPGGVGGNAGSGVGTASQLTFAGNAGGGMALRFMNEASNNTVQYVTLRSVGSSGTVVFSTTTGANGNDNNTIDHCDIRDGTTTSAYGIVSSGSTSTAAQNNSGNTVSNCNIFNFYSSTGNSAGLSLGSGNTDWTITGNSFYQTASRAAVAEIWAIYIGSGGNHLVTNNFIGGSAPGAAGAAWTATAGSVSNFFTAIELRGNAVPNGVQGNTIRNLNWASGVGTWRGIYVFSGSANVGTMTGNVIGSGTGTDSITVPNGTQLSPAGSAARWRFL